MRTNIKKPKHNAARNTSICEFAAGKTTICEFAAYQIRHVSSFQCLYATGKKYCIPTLHVHITLTLTGPIVKSGTCRIKPTHHITMFSPLSS